MDKNLSQTDPDKDNESIVFTLRQALTQISLRFQTVWSIFAGCSKVAKGPRFLQISEKTG